MSWLSVCDLIIRNVTPKRRVIQVTVEVVPIDGATLTEVSNLVRTLLAESCGCDQSDSFREVSLVNACEEYV